MTQSDIAEGSTSNQPIAVVGIGCRFPANTSSPSSFWQFLCESGNGISEIPADRWSLDIFYDEDPDAIARSTTKWGGFLGDIRGFDPAFFDISPREAHSMDPQQRLVLQVAYEAIQDANLPAARLSTLTTGVFIGVSTSDYATLQKYRRTSEEIYAGTGSALSIVSNRVAHRMNLHGPAYSVDTACSSSLVALDQACRNLRLGACEVALAGGVNILTEPSAFIAFSKANMLSRTGRISTFDARANGYVRGEGAGIVVLKPLERALQEGDRIYAVIRGTCVNQDGRTVTLTSPNPDAQMALLRQVCRTAQVDPASVGYVEAHGTGTPVGDPIEAMAIGRVFGKVERDAPVMIGSVKANIGHLESAAGISGFIKSVLSVYHGKVPPNRNFEHPNPDIPLDGLNLRVPTSVLPLPATDGVCRAVVNSFGFGGTNACALVESSARVRTDTSRSDGDTAALGGIRPVPLSAAETTALHAYAGRLAEQLGPGGSLADRGVAQIAGAQARFRDHLAERAVVLARDTEDLTTKLDLLARGEEWPTATRDEIPLIIRGRATRRRKLAFTFAGQGGQWWRMGRRLLLEEPTYRQTIDAFDEVFRPLAGWSVVDEMLASEQASRVHQAAVTQPTIFAVQIGLAALWRQQGIIPDLVIGHSFGEVAATHVAGALDLEAAARLIHKRGLLRDQAEEGSFAMATVGLPFAELGAFLPAEGGIEIAAFNGPAMTTISGLAERVQQTLAAIAAHDPNLFTRYLKMDFAWHSFALEPLEGWFRDAVGELAWRTPHTPVISTVSGIPETVFDVDYWWRNLRCPVRYADAVECALEMDADTFVELGPHRTLSGLTTGIAQAMGHTPLVVNSLHREQDDFETMTHALASLYVTGHAVDWRDTTPSLKPGSITLPRYPWTNEPYWSESEETRHMLFDAPVHPLLGEREPGPTPIWHNEINLKAYRYLVDHQVDGQVVFPGAGYIEMLLAAARDHFGEGDIELENVRFPAALSIESDDSILLRTEFEPARQLLRIHSRKRDQETDWTLRAVAKARQRTLSLARVNAAQAAAPPTVDPAPFYALARQHRLIYGPAFQGVGGVWVEDETRGNAAISRPEALNTGRHSHYLFHPALLDAGFQCPIPAMDMLAGRWQPDDRHAATVVTGSSNAFPLMLPVNIRRVRYCAPPPENFQVRYTLPTTEQEAGASFEFFDTQGDCFMALDGFVMRELASARDDESTNRKAARFYQEQLIPLEPPTFPEAVAEPAHYLLISQDRTSALRTALESRGAEVTLFDEALTDPDAAERLRSCIATLATQDTGLRGVIWTATRPAADTDDCSTDEIVHHVEHNALAVIALGQVLDRLRDLKTPPRFWLLTCGARPAPQARPLSTAGLTQSPVVGLERVLASELGEFRGVHIDADAAALTDGTSIADTILADGEETELLIRGDRAWATRLEPRKPDELPAKRTALGDAGDDRNFQVTMSSPGVIDRLVLRETPMPDLQAGDVLIRVHAVGLNFRDIMAVTALLPEQAEPEPAWQNLGLEFSAVVEAVGPAVTRFKPGDRVMGMGKRCLQRVMALPAERLIEVPDTLDLEAAATIPSAFVTAHYALNHVARLQPGEKVLIHLATGGVGLAAIQLARRAGAEILATAGSDAKRAYLRDLGIRHVMNSRALDFADQVMTATDGQGVDVILNALPGASIEKGLDCLAPYGRFLEIGKRDVYADSPIGLKALRRNNTFAVIDLASMGNDRPQLLAGLFGELVEFFRRGELEPIPMTRFAVSEVADAVRYMSQAQHIGKIVIDVTEPDVMIEMDTTRPIELDRNGTYLVTGGSRGVGVALARWLSERGARRLVLASRRGNLDEPDAGEDITARGTELETVALDVTDPVAVDALIERLAGDARPLRGIIHGAAVIEDGLLHQLDTDKIRRVIRPKVAGAWNLHRAIRRVNARLDFFVSFSSMAAVLGSMGQANYIAANAFLEAFAHYRSGHELPAGTIAWGALGDTGFVARNDAMMSYLESSGFGLIPMVQVTEALGRFLRTSSPSLMFAAVDWQQVARTNPKVKESPRLAGLVSGQQASNTRIRNELAGLPRERWPAVLIEFIRGEVAKVLQIEPAQVATERSLTEIGLDSLSSFELMHRLEAELDLGIPVTKFLQTPTLTGLAELVATTLEARQAEQAQAARSTGSEPGTPRSEGGDTLPLMPAQRLALTLYKARMTSDWGRAGLVYSLSCPLPQALDVAELQNRYARIGARHEALRLSFTTDRDGNPALTLAETPPDFENPMQPTLPTLETGRRLWQIGVRHDDGQPPKLALLCHAAAGDRHSLQRLADALLATDETADEPTQHLTEVLATQAARDDTPQWQQHQAFWSELLHDCPPALAYETRRRAPAPVGMGLNHGPAGVVQFTLPTLPVSDDPLRTEALLLAAYACAIGDAGRQTRLLIERLDTRRSTAWDTVLGPFTDSLLLPCDIADRQPDRLLARFMRRLQQVLTHSEFGTACCLTAFSDRFRASGCIPTQIGFAYDAQPLPGGQSLAGQCLDRQTDADQAGCRHDLLLNVQAQGERLIAQLRYDSDVFDTAAAERLAGTIQQTIMQLAGPAPDTDAGTTRAIRTLTLAPIPVMAQPAEHGSPATATQARPATEVGEVPLSMHQTHLLDRLSDGATTAEFKRYWWLNRALRIEPGLDPQRLQRIFDRIVDRHESLRMRFERTNGAWRAIIDAQHQTGMTVHDVGDIANEDLLRLLSDECDRQLDIEGEPLLNVSLYRCGQAGDALLLRIHHLVIDGWSHAYLLGEILQTYLGAPLPPYRGLTHRQYLEQIQGMGNADTERQRAEFWRARLSPPIAMPALGRIAKGTRPNLDLTDGGPMARLTLPLTEVGTAEVAERARRLGVTETALLIAAFATTIAEQGKVDSVYIATPMAARSDARLRDFVGWVASLATLRCEVRHHATLDRLAVDVMRQLTESETNLPADLATANAPLPEELLRAGAHPRQFFVSMLVPEGLAKLSPLGGAFYGNEDQFVEFGGVKVRALAIDEHKGIMPEIDLRSFKTENRLHYQASYDLTAFDAREIRHLLEQTCRHMGVTPDRQDLHADTDHTEPESITAYR